MFQEGRRSIISLIAFVTIISSIPIPGDAGQQCENEPTRFQGHWHLEVNGGEGNVLSTPTVADLDLDGDLEIIVVTSNGTIHAIGGPDEYLWNTSFSDNGTASSQVVYQNELQKQIFTSPLVTNLSGGPEPEIVICSDGGSLCINSTGGIIWETIRENFSSTSSPTIFEVYGDGYQPGEDIGIAVTTLYPNGSLYLNVYSNLGFLRSSTFITNGSVNLSSNVVSSDLDMSGDPDDELVVTVNDTGTFWFRQKNQDPFEFEKYFHERSRGLQVSSSVVADILDYIGKETLIIENEYNETEPVRNHTIKIFDRNGDILTSKNITGEGPVISSPVVADIDGEEDETPTAPLELIFVDLKGILHVFDITGYPHNLSEKWNFSMMSNGMTSPAVCDIDGDMNSEIVISGIGGRVYIMDGDPSDGIDEGVPYPGDGPNKDVIYVYQTSNEITRSSPIAADIDGDRVLEIITGTDEGELFVVSPSFNCFMDQIDWPTHRGNNRRTGEFIPSTRIDVEIILEDEGPPGLMKTILPGSSYGFNLTLKTKGFGDQDQWRFDLSIEDPSPGWEYSIDTPPYMGDENPDFIMIGSNLERDFRVFVTAPWEGDPGEIGRCNITATSGDIPGIDDRVGLWIGLDQFIDFELNYLTQTSKDPLDSLEGKKWDTAYPGDHGLYVISILNNGNVNDTYDLSLPEPPEGWNWTFIETGTREVNISLTAPSLMEQFGGFTGADFTMNISVPEDAMGDLMVPITVKGVSRNSGLYGSSLSRNDTLYIKIGNVPDIEIDVPDTVTLKQNKTTRFSINITNTGNTQSIRINLDFNPLPGLSIKGPEQPVYLSYKERKEININISTFGLRSPDYFVSEKGLLVSATTDFPGIYANGSIDLILENLSRISISVDPPDIQEFIPELSKHFIINISNLGNINESINISVDTGSLDGNISVWFNSETNRELPFKSWISADLRVEVTPQTPPGQHTIDLIVTNVDGKVFRKSILIQVNVVEDMVFRTTDLNNDLRLEMTPGETYRDLVSMKNTGNVNISTTIRFGKVISTNPYFMKGEVDDLDIGIIGVSTTDVYTGLTPTDIRDGSFNFTDMDDGILYQFYNGVSSMDRFIIPPGEKIHLHYEIHVFDYDGFKRARSQDISIVATRFGSEDRDVLDIHVQVMYPDLQMESNISMLGGHGGAYTDTFRIDEKIIFDFSVINRGYARSKATTIDLYIDGEEFGSLDLKELDPYQIDHFTFDMTFEEGGHTLRIVIDSDNNVYELNDQFMAGSEEGSNIHQVTFKILGEENDDGERIPIWLLLVNFSLVALLLISGLILLLLIRRKYRGIEE